MFLITTKVFLLTANFQVPHYDLPQTSHHGFSWIVQDFKKLMQQTV